MLYGDLGTVRLRRNLHGDHPVLLRHRPAVLVTEKLLKEAEMPPTTSTPFAGLIAIFAYEMM